MTHVLRSCDPIALPPTSDYATKWLDGTSPPVSGEVVVIAEPCPTCKGCCHLVCSELIDCGDCDGLGSVVAGFATIEALPVFTWGQYRGSDPEGPKTGPFVFIAQNRMANCLYQHTGDIRRIEVPDVVPGGVVIIPTPIPVVGGHAKGKRPDEAYVSSYSDVSVLVDEVGTQTELPAVGSPIQVDWHGKIGTTP